MEVINVTRNAILADRVSVANTWLTRFKGLMGKKNIETGQGLVLEPCNSIHMCFMRFSIDAVFLNEENIVMEVYKDLKPWRFTRIVRGSRRVIELPTGTVVKTSTIVGDQLILK